MAEVPAPGMVDEVHRLIVAAAEGQGVKVTGLYALALDIDRLYRQHFVPRLDKGPLTDRQIAQSIIEAVRRTIEASPEVWDQVQALIEAALEVKERQRRAS